MPGLRTGIGTISATPPLALNAKGSQSGTTFSAIAPGTIAITSGDTASRDLAATISRDTAGANAGSLTQQYDANKREEIALGFAAATQLANQTGTFFANRANEEQVARTRAEQAAANGDAVAAQRLFSEADRLHATYGSGSAARIVATAFTAAAGNGVTSGMAQLAQGVAINVLQSLSVTQVKRIADSVEGSSVERESVRAALQAVVGCAGAAAGGGSCSSAATGAAASVVVNNLLRGQDGPPRDLNGDGRLDNADLVAQQGRANLVATIAGGITALSGGNVQNGLVAAQIETENNKDVANLIRTGPRGISVEQFRRDYPDNWSKALGLFGNDEAALLAYLVLPNDNRASIEDAAAANRRGLIADAAAGDPRAAAQYDVDLRTGKTDLGSLRAVVQDRRDSQIAYLSGGDASRASVLGSLSTSQLAAAADLKRNLERLSPSAREAAIAELRNVDPDSRFASAAGAITEAIIGDENLTDAYFALRQGRSDFSDFGAGARDQIASDLSPVARFLGDAAVLSDPLNPAYQTPEGQAVVRDAYARMAQRGDSLAAGVSGAAGGLTQLAADLAPPPWVGADGVLLYTPDQQAIDAYQARTRRGIDTVTSSVKTVASGLVESVAKPIDACLDASTPGACGRATAGVARDALITVATDGTVRVAAEARAGYIALRQADNAIAEAMAPSFASRLPMEGVTSITETTAGKSVPGVATADGGRWNPPYMPGSTKRIYVTTQDTSLVRVSTGSDRGSFYAAAEDLAGKTPEEIQRFLALPETPLYIQRVTVPKGTELIESKIGPQPDFTSPIKTTIGGTQFEATGRITTPGAFGDLVPLVPGRPLPGRRP